MALRPMDLAIKQLPLDVQAVLSQDYTDLRIILYTANAFVVEGIRNQTNVLEHIEGVGLNQSILSRKMSEDFESCAADPTCPIHAIDSSVFGEHQYFRYSGHGTSLYRNFVSQSPYIGGEEGLEMLVSHLPPPLSRTRLQLLDILKTSTKLCREVQKLHNSQILHNGINPHTSYLVDGEVVLRGRCFQSTSDLNFEDEDADIPILTANLVMYLAPESTGRTNRQPDYRSDIYALGCTIYELLVGRPPFVAPDVLSYIHRHLTTKPSNIHKVSHSIPSELGEILLKCLEKSPDSRYTSMSGLIYDLEAIYQLIFDHSDLRSFEVGSLDDLLRFNISRLLCGRDVEAKLLRDAWHATSKTKRTSVVSIVGEYGIGKSQLIAGLLLQVEVGFVAASKYMQYRRDATYQALTMAIQTLARQILTHSQADIKNWRTRFLAEPSLAKTMATAVPEFRLLIGDESCAEVQLNTGVYEIRKKLHAAFIYVLSIFAADRGLLFCQDDVQWANQAELDLLTEIATQVPGLLLILARRPVEADDPIEFALDVVRTHDVRIETIRLGNLLEKDVATIVTRTLHNQSSPELDSLSHFIFEKTSGNPSLVTQLLANLHKNNKIYFRVSEMRWRFNIKAIKDEELTEDIINIITLEMRELPKPVRSLIATAAALGQERFSPASLARALNRDLDETSAQFDVAVDRNVFRSITGADILVNHDAGVDHETFSFLHGRTQESAYKLLSPAEATQVHYSIATNLFVDAESKNGESGSDELVFILADQFNQCIELLSTEEIRNAIDCDVAASKYALRTGNAVAAQHYMSTADKISENANIPAEVFQKVRFAHIEALLAGNAYDEAIRKIELTRLTCSNSREQTLCYIGHMKALIALGRLSEANEQGFAALANLKFPVPANDESAEDLAVNIAKDLNHDQASIARLLEQPYLMDDVLLQVQEVLTILVLPIYMSRPKYLLAFCYQSILITAEKGPSLEGAYPAMMLGACLSSMQGRSNLIKSRAYGEFALRLLEQAGEDQAIAPGMYHLFAGHIAVFHLPMSEVMQYEDLAVSTGKAMYNVDYTIFSLIEKPVFLTWTGKDLQQTAKEIKGTKGYVLSTKSVAANCFMAVHWNGVATLANVESDALEIYPTLQDSDPAPAIRKALSNTHAFMCELWQLIFRVYDRDIAHLRVSINRCCIEYMDGVLGTYYAAIANYLAAVALLTLQWMDVELTDVEEAIIVRSVAAMKEYAEFAPTTFLSKCKFLDALEKRRLKHDQLQLLDIYDDAITVAEQNGLVGELALILESTARWLAYVSPARGRVYMQRSFDAYKDWKCEFKIKLMQDEFPWLQVKSDAVNGASVRPLLGELHPAESQVTIDGTSYITPEDSTHQVTTSSSHGRSRSIQTHIDSFSSLATTKSRFGEGASRLQSNASTHSRGHASVGDNNTLSDLDIKTVLNASIQISQGMKAEEVFESLMKTVLLAAGADYGVLALHGMDNSANSPLSIHTLADGDSIKLMRATPALERPDLLPLAIVKSVIATRKPIIRHDEHDYFFDNAFARDRYYLSRNKPLRSVLCMPIPANSASEARGVLYLENNATASAFSNQRLECLTLLCTQSAMTLDRAAIYQEMRAARAQAEEATAQKSTFLANMSHEIRTPFNALLSCAIFLLDTKLTEVQKEYVQTIRDSATLTLSIIDGILDFSKVEQGMMDIVLAPFSLSDTIETAMQVVAQKASSANIELVYSRKHEPDSIIGDSLHLRQAVLNLLGNAVKFTAEGYVKITSSFKPGSDDAHRILSIIVQDTGIGISPSGIDRLFKAFSQVDASINRSYGGTGLGLAISKKLIELMGGSIWVESIEGTGSKFFIELPVELNDNMKNQSTLMTIEQTSEIKRQGRLALVVSRYHATADVLMDDLTEIGLIMHKNTEILNADSIAEAARERPYSLLFVDLQVDGALELVKSLQKILPSAESHFKIVILTNYGINVPQSMSSARICGYLVKPIPKHKLMDTVRSALKSVTSTRRHSAHNDDNNDEGTAKSLSQSKHDFRPLRILLAEDNIINTKVAIQHLKRLGYTDVTHAKDGIEVLEHCTKAVAHKNMFDLILMDVQMPRLDGIGATKELIRRYPDSNTRPPIVALTANATSTDKEKCTLAGMTSHLSKPILPDDLLRCLRSVQPRSTNDDSKSS